MGCEAGEAATFGERSRFVELGLLSDVAVAEALRVPAEHHGVSWADEVVEAAIALAGGYPHKVQLIGQAAWEVVRPEQRGEILVGHVRQAQEDVEEQMLGLFRTRPARVTPEQRRLLLAMAELGDDMASRGEIAARLGVDTNALSRPRQELIDRGLVEPAGHGRLRFTIPGFRCLHPRQRLNAPCFAWRLLVGRMGSAAIAQPRGGVGLV